MIALPLPPRTQDFARVHTLQLEAGWPETATLADLDGDGAPEILLAVRDGGRSSGRRLETWRPGAGGAWTRAETIALTPDVVAFAHADVRAGGGEELVLFNAGGAFTWRAGPQARPERLLACELLWQTADEDVFEWREGVRDLDGDGLADLVLPEPGGFALALQRRGSASGGDGAAWGSVSRVRVPPDPADEERADFDEDGGGGRRDRSSFSLQIRTSDEDGEEKGPLLSIHERVPAPFWLDWDADGDLDLLLQTSRHLHVWLQEEGGSFAEAPRLSLLLPVAADRTRELDASYSAHAVDLDRDHRADCVILAGDKRSEDVRTQGLFFAQAAVADGPPLFGREGRPASLLVFAGFVADPSFRDLDGDGYPELVLETFRPDLIDQIRSASTESIDADMHVYRNRGGVLSRQPDLTRRHAVALDDSEQESEFFCDLTGDGLSELLVRAEGKLRILMLRSQGPREKSTWSLVEKPLWELNVAEDARVRLVRPAGRDPASLFVLEDSQVLWVRFR
jgi:hypothetical protein